MTQDKLIKVIDDQPYPLLFATLSGAHLYGFPSPDSDFDVRGVHQLPLTKVIGLQTGQETIEVSGLYDGLKIDLVTHDVKKFFGLLLKKNGYVLEQVFSPLVIQSCDEYAELQEIAKGCITKYHCYHYLGFAASQWKVFHQPTRPPQVKTLLYVYRVLLSGIHLMETGTVEANLVTLNARFQLPYLDELIQLKIDGQETINGFDWTLHEGGYQLFCEWLEDASAKSHLPAVPAEDTVKQLNDLLIRLRMAL